MAIIVCNSLYLSTIKLQQFSLITKFSSIYNSPNSRYITSVGKKEEANLDEILKLVKAKQVECNQWQKNLETLVEAMEEEAKKVAAAKLQNAVDAMDAEQLAKLKELIEKKEKQQQ